MSKRDLLLVASTATICALIAYLTGAGQTTEPEALHPESSQASGSPATMSSRPADAAIPATVQTEPGPALPKDSSPPADANQLDGDKAQRLVLAAQRQQKFGEQLTSFIKDGSNSDPAVMNARLEGRFYSEELNRDWAGNTESHIRKLFEANENLRGTTPTQVACRSRNCQVVLPASTPQQVRVLTEKFMQAATVGDIGMKDQVVSFFPDISAGRVVFYLSEDGNTDLFR